jgi:hypothetical protein
MEEVSGTNVAEYESNASPPQIGSILDLTEVAEDLSKPPWFKVLAVQQSPTQFDKDTASTAKYRVTVKVERLQDL